MEAIPSPQPAANDNSRRRRNPRACRNCASAKAKCIPRSGIANGECERCYRLEKDCSMQDAPAQRQSRPHKRTRVDMLEKKLDGLVTLLTAQQVPPSSPAAEGPPSGPRLDPSPSSYEAQPTPRLPSLERFSPATIHSCSGFNQPDRLQFYWYGFTESQASSLLDSFRSDFAEHMPFIITPPGTAAELRRTRPFLFLTTIATASFRNITAQRRMAEMIWRYISEFLIMQAEKSLDLLQGMLVFSAWYQCHHNLKSPQLSNLLHLIQALVIDLGLNNAPRSKVFDQGLQALKASMFVAMHGHRSTPASHTLEERRAMLASFYLTSSTSVSLNKFTSFPFTPYMEECCQILDEASEYPSDKTLVQLVRLQGIAQKITVTLPYENIGSTSLWTADMPIGMYVKSLQTELDEFRKTLPMDPEKNCIRDMTLRLQYHSIEIHLHEIALHIPSTSLQQPYWRMQLLYTCLHKVKTFLDHFFTVPNTVYYYWISPPWGQLIHALIILSRLSVLEVEGFEWDLAHVREVANFSQIVEEIATRWEGSKGMLEETPATTVDDGVFVRCGRMLRRIVQVHEARLAERNAAAKAPAAERSQQEPLPVFDDTIAFFDSELLNGIFW